MATAVMSGTTNYSILHGQTRVRFKYYSTFFWNEFRALK